MNNFETLLKSVVGGRYGPSPLQNMDQILADRLSHHRMIQQITDLNSNDRIVDIGPGLGWFAQDIADHVESLLCLDINEDFLNCIRDPLSKFDNIILQKMDYADLGAIAHHRSNKVIALALFTQFNIYDFAIYLKEIHRVLPYKGIFYFDFMNSHHLNVTDNPRFLRHSSFYHKKRAEFLNLLQWHSPEFVEKCLTDIGFKINVKNTNKEFSYYVVEKLRD